MARSAEPIGGDASFEERRAASERKLARLAVARSVPPWVATLTNRHKKKADPAPSGGGDRPLRVSLGGGEKDGDSDLAGLVDHVIRDARAGEGDEAFRQEVEQDVVTPEGRGFAVPVPVRFAINYCYLDLYRPGHLNSVLLLLNIISIPEIHRTSVPE